MSKSAPAPPPAPDYAAAARAQGQANLQSGLQTAVLSNPNVISPYGNQTVTWNTDPNNPGGAPQATINQTLTPQAQQTLDAQQRTQTSLANLANTGANNAQTILGTPFQYTGPQINANAPTPGAMPTPGALQGAPGVAPLDYGPRAGQYGFATGQLDLSNVARAPVNGGTTAQQAILSRLDPEIQQQSLATQSRLANQGIPVGSEAWQNEMRQQGQQQNDLRTQAALQGINVDMAANQQGFGQALSQAGLYNQAVGQNFGQGATAAGLYNAAAGQQFGEGLAGAQFANQNQAQLYGQQLQGQSQLFGQQLQGAQFGNTAAQQLLQQQLALRNQPLNEITALESGSQIQNPQFQAYQGANVAAAPVFNAAQAQGQYGLDVYGQQVAAQNAFMNGLAGIAGVGASALIHSDRRLKTNIVQVGTHPLGVGVYEYDIFGHRERGVMAQELACVKPEAVANDDHGWLMVDYGQL